MAEFLPKSLWFYFLKTKIKAPIKRSKHVESSYTTWPLRHRLLRRLEILSQWTIRHFHCPFVHQNEEYCGHSSELSCWFFAVVCYLELWSNREWWSITNANVHKNADSNKNPELGSFLWLLSVPIFVQNINWNPCLRLLPPSIKKPYGPIKRTKFLAHLPFDATTFENISRCFWLS